MSILGGQAAIPSPGSAAAPGLPVATGQGATGQGATGRGARSQLSAGVRIVGEFQASGHLELGGRIEGVVLADSVVVEEQGEIRGEVRAGAVGVKGVFEGTLAGGAVRLHATARVAGTVLYDTLSVESGAEVTAAFKRNGG